jgi:hypothetical protein
MSIYENNIDKSVENHCKPWGGGGMAVLHTAHLCKKISVLKSAKEII